MQGKVLCLVGAMRLVDAQCKLFDALVSPVLSYGCEVWGPDAVKVGRTGLFDLDGGMAEEHVHRPFMRQSMGVRRTTASAIMLSELHRTPFKMFWIRQAVKFWNKAVKRDGSDWLNLALRENVLLASSIGHGYVANRPLWASSFLNCMHALGVSCVSDSGELGCIQVKDVDDRLNAMFQKQAWSGVESLVATVKEHHHGCHSVVRACPDDVRHGFQSLVYKQWFSSDKWVRKHSWAYHLQDVNQIRAVARFRTGGHGLNVDALRVQRVQRSRRLCTCCFVGQPMVQVREDELHFLHCAAYANVRGRYPGLFDRDVSDLVHSLDAMGLERGLTDIDACMRKGVNGTTCEFWTNFADFLRECMVVRHMKLLQ